ncbi:hypothetical protein K491DRAFT_784133 [Lophiostoma macrostomum CBS 122681]|uniref:Mid2 domain-containing protein n=1 Tax=Lophiostoma macrostomum CBS 122681 TaxID=1314788 RepID=A0A6A6SPL8_9PLEO|nr:hypothetical protein K491DRAFT_784133 [Lophiostoma macrostomum CBS 122681]
MFTLMTSLTGLLPLVYALCYMPSGDLTNDQPCNPDADVSQCCALGDFCTSNHLCLPPNFLNSTGGSTVSLYIRGTCTDDSWQSPECGGACVAELPNEGEKVWQCSSEYFCCKDQGCCDDMTVTKLKLGFASITATVGETSSTATTTQVLSSSSTATITTSSTLTPPTESIVTENDGASSTGTKIGIGVGVSVGILLIICLSGGVWWYKRKRNVGNVLDHRLDVPELVGISAPPALGSPKVTYALRENSPMELP